jgi:hypothetical protein
MGMFDDLFTKDDFLFEEEEEEQELELETSDDEEEDGPHDPKDTCGPDCSCDTDEPDGSCTCDPDDNEACSDCGGAGGATDDNSEKSVWDTGYRKPPVPRKVWKPKTWKT